jgi:putative ABC transport system substrate-binding protein
MRRRRFSAGLMGGAVAWPAFARAQQPGRAAPATILVVGAIPANLAPQGLRRGLQELGYVEGRDFSLDYYAGDPAGVPNKLERRPVSAIFAVASSGVMTARRATTTIPIVAVDLESEPVADRLVASFARPGGNLTGLFLDQPGLAGKWLQLITEVVPRASRLAALRDPDLVSSQWRAVESASARLGLQLHPFELDVAALERVFGEIASFGPHSLIILSSPHIVPKRETLATFAAKARLPSIALFRAYAEAGGLMSYGPSPYTMGRHAARYVDRIWKGASPSDLPIEQPGELELVINLKTAQMLGLTISPVILGRANEVIE